MPQTMRPVYHDVSRPLWEMSAFAIPVTGQPKEGPEVGELPLHRWPAQKDPVVQSAMGPALATTPGLNFDGIGQGAYGFSVMYAPTDSNGAVGATQYVEWLNVDFAVFDKATGNLLSGPTPGNALWNGFGGYCQSNNNGDPIAQYDKAANRWVMTQFALNSGGPFYQCVAVSTTSDALGTYSRYAFQFANFPDYPKLGVWPDGYYVSFNMFDPYGSSFLGAQACAFDRVSMLAGGAAAGAICFQQSSSVLGMLPSDLDGNLAPPAGSPNYFVNFGTNSLNLWQFHVDFTTPANSTFTGPASIPVSAFNPLCWAQCVPQLNSSQYLDGLGDRMMYRLAYRNFGAYESMVVNHSVQLTSNSGVRWYELRGPWSAPAVYQQGTFAPDANYRWMGSIAMDESGDIALGYSVSSASLYPEIAYTGRIPSDPLGTMEAENVIVAGTGSQQYGLRRWGDYSSMAIDPVDDCTFWYVNQYLQTSGTFNWSTRIASFKFPSCNSVPYYGLTVSTAGLGKGIVTSSPAGISCPTTCAANYQQGTTVVLTATHRANSVFAGWSGACSGLGKCTVAMNAPAAVTATFNSTLPSYSVSVSEAGPGNGTITSTPAGISCGTTCMASYLSGTKLKLVATPDSSSKFTGWSGGCTATTRTCAVTVTGNISTVANFAILTYPLKVSISGVGGGTVTSDLAGINCPTKCNAPYNIGTVVTLTATPAALSSFAGWGGPCSGKGTCQVTMNAAQTVTARFNNPTVTVTNPDKEAGTVTSSPAGISCGKVCTASFAPNSTVTLTAAPTPGNQFGHWTGDCSGTQKTCTLTIDGNKSVAITYQ